jgi:hypothetical protein
MFMASLTLDEIKKAIRRLSSDERQQLFEEFFEHEQEAEKDVVMLERALDEADQGKGIPDDQLATYMAARRKERRRAQVKG